jgi:hypothetical protein
MFGGFVKKISEFGWKQAVPDSMTARIYFTAPRVLRFRDSQLDQTTNSSAPNPAPDG